MSRANRLPRRVDVIVILDLFSKKTQTMPVQIVEVCQERPEVSCRLATYDDILLKNLCVLTQAPPCASYPLLDYYVVRCLTRDSE